MITLANVRKSFGGNLVLDEISFSLSPGEIVGFVGANGSGKTTTMRAIMGLVTIDSGAVTIDGQSPRRDRQILQSLGYLPEERGLYMNEPLLSQLHFFAELQGLSQQNRNENCGIEKVGKCMEFDVPRMILLKHLARMLDRTFGPTLRPTELLGLDRGENGRKFGRGFDFWPVHKLPAFPLRAVT